MEKINYGRQSIIQEDIDAVVSVLKSDFLTQGPSIDLFEKNFSTFVGSKYAVAVSSATAGLHLSAIALGLKKGDRVITTPITFAASANCVRYLGCQVWLSDIDPDTYLMDLDKLSELISSKPKGFFKAVVAVNFGGLPLNLEKLSRIANEHNLFVIEDACHSPGAYFTNDKGVPIYSGSGKYSDLSVFSFHPVKHIASGEGGMITTNSEELYHKIRLLRSHGINRTQNRIEGPWAYDMEALGFNYRLTDFQAALGNSQLKRNTENVKRRNEIADFYKSNFSDHLKFQKEINNGLNAYHLFVIESEDRSGMYNYLKSHGIFCQIHYIPIHYLRYYQSFGYNEADLKHSETYYSRCLSLPMYPSLTDSQLTKIVDLILTFNRGI